MQILCNLTSPNISYVSFLNKLHMVYLRAATNNRMNAMLSWNFLHSTNESLAFEFKPIHISRMWAECSPMSCQNLRWMISSPVLKILPFPWSLISTFCPICLSISNLVFWTLIKLIVSTIYSILKASLRLLQTSYTLSTASAKDLCTTKSGLW